MANDTWKNKLPGYIHYKVKPILAAGYVFNGDKFVKQGKNNITIRIVNECSTGAIKQMMNNKSV